MIEAELSRSVQRWCPGATGVTGAAKLSGGASQETWRFDIMHPDGPIGAILRRSPKGYGAAPTRAAGLAAEAQLMQLAFEAGVPSPCVMHVLTPDEDLGTGFIMQRVEGETIARKILRDEEFAAARPRLARQIGGVLAGLHRLPQDKLPELRSRSATEEISEFERDYRSLDWPKPVFELALRWLHDHDPGPRSRPRWCMAISATAISSSAPTAFARCWTGSSLISAIPWRISVGSASIPGALAKSTSLSAALVRARSCSLATRQQVGKSISSRVKFWEVMGTLRWGIMCGGMMQRFREGPDHSMERAMIGRRASETEIDLLRLLAPRGG